MKTKLITWNVNGFRAVLKKGFQEYFESAAPDMMCLQETKLQPQQVEFDSPGYFQYWNSALKKGYSGTGLLARRKPEAVTMPFDGEGSSCPEGRVLTADFGNFYLVTVYTPNSQEGLARLDFRMEWEDGFADYLAGLDREKPVIVCGDLNVAHREIDLKNPGPNRGNAGFTPQERDKFTRLLERGFTDTFRHLYPEKEGAYTWWSYRFNARANNAGWRIDYFLVSDRIRDRIEDVVIRSDVSGSDHCPVELLADL